MHRETHIESYEGPLPPPSLLREFESVQKGFAERIMHAFEQQSQHRQLLERVSITGDSRRAWCGLIGGGIVVLAILAGAVTVILNGHDGAGAAIAGLDIVGVATAFIYGSSSRRRERQQKQKQMVRARPAPRDNEPQPD